MKQMRHDNCKFVPINSRRHKNCTNNMHIVYKLKSNRATADRRILHTKETRQPNILLHLYKLIDCLDRKMDTNQ